MNQNNKAVLLARIARVREFLDALETTVDDGAVNATNGLAEAVARQVGLLSEEVRAVSDGC